MKGYLLICFASKHIIAFGIFGLSARAKDV